MEQSEFYTYEIMGRINPRCNVCGAVVGDIEQHTAWHRQLSAGHPDPADLVNPR